MTWLFRLPGRIFQIVKGTLLVLVSVGFVLRLLGSLAAIGASLPLARRAATWRFRRRLRAIGLDASATLALVDEYRESLRLFGRGRPWRPRASS